MSISKPRDLGLRLRISALSLALWAASAASAAAVPVAALTPDVRWLLDRVTHTHDNGHDEFIVVDKRAAQVHVFDAGGHLQASSPVLLGAALGDDSVPGIGSRPMAEILPGERTTPAGRFVGELGRNSHGDDIVWVDYDAAVSMHRVRLNNPVERRAERLATPTAADNRISFGCINLPVAFYEQHVQPIFARHKAVIYVLPDTRPVQTVFGSINEQLQARAR